MHKSIKLNTPCEFINIAPLNPLISKCQIKVCYVSDEPNRNKSIINKETAKKLANSLPGSPIVGFYNDATEDFEEHNRCIELSDGEFRIKDTTRPYGFVDLGAKCWFQIFEDDGAIQREYLMTEGYLWTGQYPEAKRIIEKGNNQSMELDDKLIDASWTKDDNEKPQFFIINEAIISKLCILGEDYEPCFEGASITKVQFSFENDFKEQLFSMMTELKELLSKGGTQVFTTYAVKVGDSLWSALYDYTQENNFSSIEAVLEDGEQKFAVLKDSNDAVFRLDFSISEEGSISFGESATVMENYVPAEEPQFALADVEAFVNDYKCEKEKNKDFKKEEDKEDKSKEPNSDNKTEEADSSKEDSEKDPEESKDKKDEEDEKKKEYSLDEIPEYVELASKFSDLESQYNNLVAEKEKLELEIEPLKQFKLNTEKIQKEDMINNQFYMLSDEDKKDVIENINNYSLDEIEAKLSIICVRNKVSFVVDDDRKENPTTYNLGGNLFQDESTPAWVKAVLDTAKTLN